MSRESEVVALDRSTRWLLVGDEGAEVWGDCDPDDEETVHYVIEEHIGEDARAALDSGDYRLVVVTPEYRRELRNARRREMYAWARDDAPPRSPPCDPPLSMLSAMAVHDDAGRVRCPKCKRFCVGADFGGRQDTTIRIPGAVVHVGPACYRCRGVPRPWGTL